jgi:hypothetical protein
VTNAALAGAAGSAGLVCGLGGRGESFAEEPPPEITTIRLKRTRHLYAPQVV